MRYRDADGFLALTLFVLRPGAIPIHVRASGQSIGNTEEPRTIDGHPAILWYDPAGETWQGTRVRIFEEATGIEYVVDAYHGSIRRDPDATIGIARSLYR